MAAPHDLSIQLWPLPRLGEGLHALAQRAGLGAGAGPSQAPTLPAAVLEGSAAEQQRWLVWAAARCGAQAEPVECPLADVADTLRRAAPALVQVDDGFVLLLGQARGGAGRGELRLLGPDLRVRRCPTETLRAALCKGHEAPLRPEIDRLLRQAQVAPERQAAARKALLQQRLAHQSLRGLWLLRQGAETAWWRQLAQARLPQRVGGILALFAAIYTLEIAGWRLIGEAALDGHFDLGWLAAWVLMLLSMVPLRLLSSWFNTRFALDAGRLLKQRLLAGVLKLDLDDVRRQGTGQLLGRVIESQALESVGLAGALGAAVALLELGFALWILAQGVAAAWHLPLALAWLALNAALAWRYHARLRDWTAQRLAMTNALVERMVGHRTRLAQEQPARRDAQEDAELQAYLQASQRMDAAITPVAAGAPGGWILLGLLALAPALLAGSATPAGLAISLGGVLFAHRAFNGLAGSLSALARAAVAWRQVATIFRAGAAQEEPPAPFVGQAQLAPRADDQRAAPLVDAQQLVYRYRAQGEAALRGADLAIGAGERVLLQGPSGGGKSTLAAQLVGLRQPESGLLLMNGLDRHTLGPAWPLLATEAPQFHENHVLTGTLAFNLLMGAAWPPSPAQLQEARELCEELGLGELLARMPAGLQQRVGETGWQLSHGEKSRLFLARALLQGTPLTVLDESFAALDPETLQRCLDCALKRSRALVVIAHP